MLPKGCESGIEARRRRNANKVCSQNPMTKKSESELQFMFDFGERTQGKSLFTWVQTALPLHPWQQLPQAESNS